MNKLLHTIESLRQKLPALRRHSLKETPTRTIIIDPLLESLGWDIRDPDEVQLEYPCIDGKSVDYALKMGKRVALLVEAKALDDPLSEVKAITQIVGYAANNGIMWCVLTNGAKWRIYRSMERCPAPEKLMFEVSLDPADAEGMTTEQVARQLWRLSAEEIGKGTLDALGEQTFTDSRVRKAVQGLMSDPPSSFVALVRRLTGDEAVAPKRIRESLIRLANEAKGVEPVRADVSDANPPSPDRRGRSSAAKKAWVTRRERRSPSQYDEAHHLKGMPQEVVELYRAVDRFCMQLAPSTARRYLAKTVNYDHEKRTFCSVHVLRAGLRVWLPLKLGQLASPPSFARDVSAIGHWGRGDLELRISSRPDFEQASALIRHSFESGK